MSEKHINRISTWMSILGFLLTLLIFFTARPYLRDWFSSGSKSNDEHPAFGQPAPQQDTTKRTDFVSAPSTDQKSQQTVTPNYSSPDNNTPKDGGRLTTVNTTTETDNINQPATNTSIPENTQNTTPTSENIKPQDKVHFVEYVKKTCPDCGGRGLVSQQGICTICNGSGKKDCPDCRGKGGVPCGACHGTGVWPMSMSWGSGQPCTNCKGTGKLSICNTCAGSGKSDETCTACNGAKIRITEEVCRTCNGSGKITVAN